ncbi:MAG: hypothetical protein JXA03_08720 [Bacteroidales bacterium]|nr:hypothetical protein [Bacteroidales bacterium]
MKSLWIGLILLFQHIMLFGQGQNYDYEKIKVGDNLHLFSWVDMAPDNNTVVLTSVQSYPCIIYDLGKREIVKELDLGNWYAGSRAEYSKTGRFLLIQQLFYIDFSPNKDREVTFEVVESLTGKTVLRFDACHSVKITPDEKYAVALTGDEVSFWSLETGSKEKSYSVPNASNAIGISPDGKKLAVSHLPEKEDLFLINPNLDTKSQKDNLKAMLKYKQLVTIYDMDTFEKLYTVKEIYDIVYGLNYDENGEFLMVYSAPHTKMVTATGGRQSFLHFIDAASGEPMRKTFPCFANYEPDYKLSPDKKLFGLTTNAKFPELYIYNFETGKILTRFELSYRLFDNMSKGDFPGDGRFAFEFMPDGSHVVLTYGNQLLIWNMEPDNK